MSQYIVCKVRLDGTVIAGTPPVVHTNWEIAKAEAERLAGTNPDAQKYIIFKAHAETERLNVPVRTVYLA